MTIVERPPTFQRAIAKYLKDGLAAPLVAAVESRANEILEYYIRKEKPDD